jgi:hypothetical protein
LYYSYWKGNQVRFPTRILLSYFTETTKPYGYDFPYKLCIMYFIFRQLKSDRGVEGAWKDKLQCDNGFFNGVELRLGDAKDGATNIAMCCGSQEMYMKV